LTKTGNPKPGKFDYKQTSDPPDQEDDYTFLLTDLGFGADDEIYIAVHVVVVLLDEYGNVIQQETAWVCPDDGMDFPGANWATYFSYTVQECYYSGTGSSLSGFRTQTQGGWSTTASGDNPGTYRDAHFSSVFPSGLVVGCQTDGYTLTLTTSLKVVDFLPASGPSGALTQDYVDWNDGGSTSVHHPGGNLSGQTVALTLNVEFDLADANFGASATNLADLVVVCSCSPCVGMTVQQVLDAANEILGGCYTGTLSASDINDCASKINEAFVDGKPQTSGFLALP
jgi:hypothetical protein